MGVWILKKRIRYFSAVMVIMLSFLLLSGCGKSDPKQRVDSMLQGSWIAKAENWAFGHFEHTITFASGKYTYTSKWGEMLSPTSSGNYVIGDSTIDLVKSDGSIEKSLAYTYDSETKVLVIWFSDGVELKRN